MGLYKKKDKMKTGNDGVRVVNLNAAVYGLHAINKAADKFRGRLYILVEQLGNANEVRLIPEACCKSLDGLVRDFCNEVLDQELRERVAREMTRIRSLLLAEALAKISLTSCA